MVCFVSGLGGSKNVRIPKNSQTPFSEPFVRATAKLRMPRCASSNTLPSTAARICSLFAHISRITCGAPFATLMDWPFDFNWTVDSVFLTLGSNGV